MTERKCPLYYSQKYAHGCKISIDIPINIYILSVSWLDIDDYDIYRII